MNENIKKRITDVVEKNDVCLFMKGTPEVPQCGFSLAVSNMLKHLEVNFKGINVLENNEIRGVQADVVDEQTYANFLNNEVLFFGDGALKCKEIIHHKNAKFLERVYPSAKDLGKLAYAQFKSKDFEDVAYFEPFYLKDFVAGKKEA